MSLEGPSGAVALLHEDPELAIGLSGEELVVAERLLFVPVLTVDVGPWSMPDEAGGPVLGLLALEGLVTVNVVLGDRVASLLAGPGDVLHGSLLVDALLPATVEYHVSERARLAVLDRRFIAAVRRWPALLLALHERLRVQEHRLAVHAAIGKLRRVEDRVLALLWHLADRWGRMTADGIVVPLALTHETIGRLAGGERPTITLALGELARSGAVVRRPDGAFLLRPGSEAALAARPPQHAAPRPLAVVRTADAPVLPATTGDGRPQLIDAVALRARVAALHDDLPERSRDVEQLLAASRATVRRSAATRARIAADRATRAG